MLIKVISLYRYLNQDMSHCVADPLPAGLIVGFLQGRHGYGLVS